MQVRWGFSIVASNGQLDVWALVTLASTLKVRLGGGVEVVETQTAHTGKGRKRCISVCPSEGNGKGQKVIVDAPTCAVKRRFGTLWSGMS